MRASSELMIIAVIRNEAEAKQMYAWASRFAREGDRFLQIIVAMSGRGEGRVTDEEPSEAWLQRLRESLPEWAKMSWLRSEKRLEVLLDYISQQEVELVVVGKHETSHRSDADTLLSYGLFERVLCPVLIMRLGDGGHPEREVLVPCSGGRHSQGALKLACEFAPEQVTALFVTANVDKDSHLMGERVLRKLITRSDVTLDEVRSKVVLSGHVREGIRQELAERDYGLVIVGASGEDGVRRKLFGLVPNRIDQDERGIAVAVLRSSKSASHRFRDWIASRIALRIPQLSREDRVALMEEIEGKARWSFDFAALMGMATLIASLGLLANSGAVVIGAMLVAPLMMPLIGSGLAVVQGNWPLWARGMKAVGLGFLAALIIGLLSGLLARVAGFTLTDELTARGNPTLLDLGIAFVSGVAASYCLARPKLSGALAGVAIAAALVPPIATVGITVSLGAWSVATGAALLFGTNVVTVILGSAFNFWLAGLRGRGEGGEWRRRMLIFLMLACIGCAVPLTLVLIDGFGW